MNRKPHHGPPPRTRTRRRLPTGAWEVRARVERFIEPALPGVKDAEIIKGFGIIRVDPHRFPVVMEGAIGRTLI